MTTSNSYKDCR